MRYRPERWIHRFASSRFAFTSETAQMSAMVPKARVPGGVIFQDSGCIQCHGGPMLSDFKLHFIGVSDGTADGRREFRTPTLRNLRHTAPYMHDGTLRTLRDVLVFYDELTEAVSKTLDGGGTTAQLG